MKKNDTQKKEIIKKWNIKLCTLYVKEKSFKNVLLSYDGQETNFST